MTEQEKESELVIRVQNGELEAYEELLRLHSSRLRAFVAMKLPVPHLIDEIAHETFIFAHRHIHQFEAGTNFGKWLRAIAFNLTRKETLRYQRATKNKEKLAEHLIIEHATKSPLSPDSPTIIYLEECLEQLNGQQRALLEQKYQFSSSSRDMAIAFNQSESWVRTTLCRIRATLRKCIELKMEAST